MQVDHVYMQMLVNSTEKVPSQLFTPSPLNPIGHLQSFEWSSWKYPFQEAKKINFQLRRWLFKNLRHWHRRRNTYNASRVSIATSGFSPASSIVDTTMQSSRGCQVKNVESRPYKKIHKMHLDKYYSKTTYILRKREKTCRMALKTFENIAFQSK